jgi:ribose/xylose/arabinose/galactoside ABC-type transport system permease subunit
VNPTPKSDLMLAWAQIILAFFFTVGIFGLVYFLLISKTETPPAILTIAGSVIASLITVLTLQMNYFFARQRPPTLPDPSLTSTTTTTTTTPAPTIVPEGSKLVPAPAPPSALVPDPTGDANATATNSPPPDSRV